jgi:hypothetical protein
MANTDDEAVGRWSMSEGSRVKKIFGQDFGGGFVRESVQRLAVGRIG